MQKYYKELKILLAVDVAIVIRQSKFPKGHEAVIISKLQI